MTLLKIERFIIDLVSLLSDYVPIVFILLFVSGFEIVAGLRVMQCSDKLQVLGADSYNSDSST